MLLFVDGARGTPIGRRGRGSAAVRRFVVELGSVERGFAAGCSGSTEMEFGRWYGQVHLLKVWRSTPAQLKIQLGEGGRSIGSHAVCARAGWGLEAGRRVEVLCSGRMEEEATPSAKQSPSYSCRACHCSRLFTANATTDRVREADATSDKRCEREVSGAIAGRARFRQAGNLQAISGLKRQCGALIAMYVGAQESRKRRKEPV